MAKASAGIARLHDPVVGNLELNVEDLVLPGDPDQTLRVDSAPPGSSSADSLTLLGSFGAGTGTPEAAQASKEGTGPTLPRPLIPEPLPDQTVAQGHQQAGGSRSADETNRRGPARQRRMVPQPFDLLL
ncbi:MmyB family transcriptional regulator [Arthrobacter sp. MMS18-M83]|uniref:MmyB family transcriptional regulator n=1 Tax=Arthrobacter sp. MMS18-M83 TaxID=2996261 RepID=UPI003FA34E03